MKSATKQASAKLLLDGEDEEYEVPLYRPRRNFSAAEVAEELGCEIVSRRDEMDAEMDRDVVAAITDPSVGSFLCRRPK